MKVYVESPARLHMGLLDLGGDLGRIFGGLGVAIDHPNVVLEARLSENLTVAGERTDLVKPMVRRVLEAYRLDAKVEVTVQQVIPEHVGLGSETQLALAVSSAIAELFNVKATLQELAFIMGKGHISGVGTSVFEHGGFVVEAGLKTKDGKPHLSEPEGFPPVVFRHQFPEDWRLVVAIPNVRQGLTDEEEVPAFEGLPPMASQDVGKICRLVVMKLLPSLIEHDIESFGDALTQIQIIVGEFFAGVQGGRYSSTIAEALADHMTSYGAYGVGQSSWGPAFYGLVDSEIQAKELQSNTQTLLDDSLGGQVFIAMANNSGAMIKRIAEE